MAHEETADRVKSGLLEKQIADADDVVLLKDIEAKLMELGSDLECQYTEKAAALGNFEQECRARGAAGKGEFFKKKADYQSWKAKTSRYKSAVAARLRQVRLRLQTLSANRVQGLDDRVTRLEERADGSDQKFRGVDSDIQHLKEKMP